MHHDHVRRRLPFEGFLEALCRLSILKALPTAAELAEAEEPDAGSFLINLEESDQVTYAAFLKVDAGPRAWEPPTLPCVSPASVPPVSGCAAHVRRTKTRALCGASRRVASRSPSASRA